jgi:hypothetical protein
MDRKSNVAFYDSTTMTPERIFVSSPSIAPDVANTFVQILTAQTSRLPRQSEMRSEMQPAAIQSATEDRPSEVRTFRLPEAEELTDID